jgi:hypothetical protein
MGDDPIVFTKKKIIIFIVACIAFLAADLWMFSTVKAFFGKTMVQNSKTLALALVKSAPREEASVESWIDGLAQTYQGYSFYYFSGLPGEDGYREVAGDAELMAFWTAKPQDSPEVLAAIDAVSYRNRMDRRFNAEPGRRPDSQRSQ